MKEIGDDIANLECLEIINLSFNLRLESLSCKLASLPLKELILDGCCALKTPPMEIVRKGFQAIIGFMKRLLSGSVTCKRTKLMLIGLGGAGKTSLLNTLMKKTEETEVTDGISIKTWYIPDKDLTFSAWDFAGQSVYYNTHQFFLTNRSIYLLLWNMRLGFEHAGLDFWLSSVTCHAPNAPVFVIGTHSDLISRFTLPVDSLKKRFPQIVNFFYVSTYTLDGIDNLRDDIINCALQEWYMGEQIPKVWLSFEQQIAQKHLLEKRDLLSWAELKEIGFAQGVVEESETNEVCQFLHELGSIQHFSSNEMLKEQVVINPQWIVDVMKCVVSINESAIKDGKFYHRDIPTIWQDYPKDLHKWLLHLTEEFDLTFEATKSESQEPYNMVPCLMPEVQPIFSWPSPSVEDSIFETKFLYKFTFIPAGLFNRAQVRLSQYSDSFIMWKKGSLLSKNSQRCLMTEEKKNRIQVKAIGSHPYNMLFLVHEVLDGIINESFSGITYNLFISCRDCVLSGSRDPALFAASDVKRAASHKVPLIQCRQQFHSIPLEQVQSELPSDSRDENQIRLQFQTGVTELEEMNREMQKHIFFLYSTNDQDDPAITSPTKIMSGLEMNSQFVCHSQQGFETEEETVLKVKTSGMVVVCMSENLTEDQKCKDLVSYTHATLKKDMQIIILDKFRNWSQTTIGSMFAGDLYVDFASAEQFDAKIQELANILEGKTDKEKKTSQHPSCFLSYCWSNSLMAIESSGMVKKDSALGWMDPRQLKEEMENCGIKCWLDVEQVGLSGGLFEDIAEGLRHAKVVVACISEEYAKSRNCQMEFRFASTSLKLPIVIAIVGQGGDWRATEVGMLAMSYPEYNLQFEAPNVVGKLVEKVSQVIETAESIDEGSSMDQSSSSSSSLSRSIIMQEMIELNQRKLLRYLEDFAKPFEKENSPSPRIFALDLIPQMTADNEFVMVEMIGKSEQQMEELTTDRVGLRYVCEYERGWHPVSMTLKIASTTTSTTKSKEVFREVCVFALMMLKLLKFGNSEMPIMSEEGIASRLETLAASCKEVMNLFLSVLVYDKSEGIGVSIRF